MIWRRNEVYEHRNSNNQPCHLFLLPPLWIALISPVSSDSLSWQDPDQSRIFNCPIPYILRSGTGTMQALTTQRLTNKSRNWRESLSFQAAWWQICCRLQGCVFAQFTPPWSPCSCNTLVKDARPTSSRARGRRACRVTLKCSCSGFARRTFSGLITSALTVQTKQGSCFLLTQVMCLFLHLHAWVPRDLEFVCVVLAMPACTCLISLLESLEIPMMIVQTWYSWSMCKGHKYKLGVWDWLDVAVATEGLGGGVHGLFLFSKQLQLIYPLTLYYMFACEVQMQQVWQRKNK